MTADTRSLGRVFIAATAIIAATVTTLSALIPDHISPSQPVLAPGQSWPARGALSSDTALIAAAEQAWRLTSRQEVRPAEAAPIHALYADATPPGLASVTVVALATDDQVAFLTTPARRGPATGQPEGLFVRAVLDLPQRGLAGLAGVGFVATTPNPADTPIPSGGAFGFALAAHGHQVHLVTSMTTQHLGGPSGNAADGAVDARVMPAAAGAWNTALAVDGRMHGPDEAPVASSLDDPLVRSTSLIVSADGAWATGAAADDLVVTPSGWVGVADAEGRVRTGLPPSVAAATEITRITARVSGDDNVVLAEAGAPPGNRLILSSRALPAVRVVLGSLDDDTGPRRRLTRAVGVIDTRTVLLVGAR